LKNKIINLLILSVIAAGSGCHPGSHPTGGTGQAHISRQNIKVNLEVLAADDLEGREATRRGEKLAALFLDSELKKYGVQPFPAAGSYFQSVELRFIRFSTESGLNLVDWEGQLIDTFLYGEDFIGAIRPYPAIDTTVGLVFAGYGISAAEFQYDDYATVDADGKVVVIFPGEPASTDSTYFDGKQDSRYASPRSKMNNAREHGAAGIIYLSPFEKTFGWDKMKEYVGKGTYRLKDETADEGDLSNTIGIPSVTIREKALGSFFAAEKYSSDSLLVLLADHKPLPVFIFKKRIQLSWRFETEHILPTYNVIGIIPGTDSALEGEYVGIGAHYDHVGVMRDTVYNGADDNASGTVAILEAARALARIHKNKRSILIIFHTAEEKGLLGSRFLAQDPELTERMMAYINLDMVGGGALDSIYSIGGDRTAGELQQIAERVNARTVKFNFNYRFNGNNDPERLSYRSDHYSYARKGVPAIFFFDNFMKYYHTSADDPQTLNVDKITRVAELTYHLALELANHRGRLKP
jgi:hypothetical protein